MGLQSLFYSLLDGLDLASISVRASESILHLLYCLPLNITSLVYLHKVEQLMEYFLAGGGSAFQKLNDYMN